MKPDRVCKNCKHWNYDDEWDSNFADCDIIGDCNEKINKNGKCIRAETESIMLEDVPKHNQILSHYWFEVNKYFSCIYWEKK
jgi:hypothetical protein